MGRSGFVVGEGCIVMASGTFGPVAGPLQRLFRDGTVAGLSEAQLLDRFSRRRDESAFASLVERHGPMVLAVCRRILRDEHAAEDAFQATFLLLVRRAGTIRGQDALGPWLHRVAYRVAIRAGRADSRRKAKEALSTDAVERAAASRRTEHDLRLTIHDMLDALPEKYRAPVVLCDLQGWTHDEAAKSLRWPIGSVKGRLSRARDLLRTRLARQGVTATSATIALALSRDTLAALPPPLIQKTIEAATAIAAGRAMAAGLVPASASALVEEAVRVMFWDKIKLLAASLIAVGMLAGGAGVMARQQGSKGAEAIASKAADPRTELEKLQGDWGRVSVTKDGKVVDVNIQEKLAIRDDLLYHRDNAGKLIDPRKLEILPGKDPAQLRTSESDGKSLTMLYKIEGDTLTVCGNLKDASEAPPEFGSTESRVLFVYRRENPPPPAGEAARLELDKMQGVWHRVLSESQGVRTPSGRNPRFPRVKLTISGDSFQFYAGPNVVPEAPRLARISPEKSPKQIDLTPQIKPTDSPSEPATLGIYQLDGDTLTLCRNLPGADRPSEFATRADSTCFVDVYEREPAPAPPAGTAANPKEKSDQEKMQGRWECIRIEANGSKFDPEAGDPLNHILIRNDNLIVVRDDDLVGRPRVLNLNPSTSPKQFEWRRASTGDDWEFTSGIYKVDDSSLTLAYDVHNPKVAPPDFPEKAGDGGFVRVYRREARTLEATAEEKAELAKLQGTWKIVGKEDGGEDISEKLTDHERKIRWSVRENLWTNRLVDAPVSGPWRIRLDLSRTPFVMERSETEKTQPRRNPLKPTTDRVNYKVEGDRLVVCSFTRGPSVGQAPGELVTRPGDARTLLILRRVTEAESPPMPLSSPTYVSNGPVRTMEMKPAKQEKAGEPREEVAASVELARIDLDLAQMDMEELTRHIHNLSQMISNTEIAAVSKMPAKGATVSGTTPQEQDQNLGQAKLRLRELKNQWMTKRLENAAKRRKIEQMDGEVAALADKGPAAKVRAGKPGTIQVGDVLRVDVLEALPGRPISGEVLVRQDETISLGFYGDIHVVGLTRRECKSKIVAHLRKFLKDEVLGLTDLDNDGKTISIDPADSDRVVVDDAPVAKLDAVDFERRLERKIDRLMSEIETIKARQASGTKK